MSFIVEWWHKCIDKFPDEIITKVGFVMGPMIYLDIRIFHAQTKNTNSFFNIIVVPLITRRNEIVLIIACCLSINYFHQNSGTIIWHGHINSNFDNCACTMRGWGHSIRWHTAHHHSFHYVEFNFQWCWPKKSRAVICFACRREFFLPLNTDCCIQCYVAGVVHRCHCYPAVVCERRLNAITMTAGRPNARQWTHNNNTKWNFFRCFQIEIDCFIAGVHSMRNKSFFELEQNSDQQP